MQPPLQPSSKSTQNPGSNPTLDVDSQIALIMNNVDSSASFMSAVVDQLEPPLSSTNTSQDDDNDEFHEAKATHSMANSRAHSPAPNSLRTTPVFGKHPVDKPAGDKHASIVAPESPPPKLDKSKKGMSWQEESNLDPLLITAQSTTRVKELIKDIDSYFNLVLFLLFVILYMIVLVFQTGANEGGRELRGSLLEKLFSEGGGVDDFTSSGAAAGTGPVPFSYDGSLSSDATFDDASTFLDWFKHDILADVFDPTTTNWVGQKVNKREFLNDNTVVVGALLRQTRATKSTQCSTSQFFDQQICSHITDHYKPSDEPFGTDVTFVSTSNVYNNADQADFFTADEINPVTSLPYGFFSSAQTSDVTDPSFGVSFGSRPDTALDRFPVFFDSRMSREHANDLTMYLDEAGYVDEYTRVIDASLVTYNKVYELFAKITVTATLNLASQKWEIEATVDMIDVVVYSDSKEDTVRKVLEAFYLTSLCCLIFKELLELKDFVHKYGKVAGIIMYATDFGNVADVSNYAIQVLSNLSWLSFALMGSDWKPKLTYDVVEDLEAKNNFFKAGDGFPDGLQVFSDVKEFAEARDIHLTLACISLVLCVIQLIKNLDFHPKMGLISRTIGKAAGAMTFFFLLFFGVVVVYAFLGSIQYGSTMASFSTSIEATQTLLIMLCGEFGDFKEEMDEVNKAISNFYFWTFFCICYFILMNAFLAIIVEAYEAAKTGFDAFSYSDAMSFIIRRHIRMKKRGGDVHIPDQELEEILDWCMDVWDADETDDKKPPEILEQVKEGERFAGISVDGIRHSGRAMVVRIEPGDTAEDGTVDEKGQRLFFSELHLQKAIMKSTVNKIESEFVARIVAHNVVERFGMKADVNGDGEITNGELLALAASGRHKTNTLMQMTLNLANKAQDLAQVDKIEDGMMGGFTTMRKSVMVVGGAVGGGIGEGAGALGAVGKGVDGLTGGLAGDLAKRTHRISTGATGAAALAASKFSRGVGEVFNGRSRPSKGGKDEIEMQRGGLPPGQIASPGASDLGF